MAIVRIGAFGTSYLAPAAFESEEEIARAIAENPQLLVADGAAPPVLVTQRLLLPDSTLDLLFLDLRSIPIVVESRLAKSDGCRREVVAQVIDDLSALAQLTVTQFDEAAGGAVERALRQIAGNSNDFDLLWTSLAANLRAARVKFVVAIDELSPSMDRQIRFLAEHSNLDVLCVEVAKFLEPSGETYYAPVARVPSPKAIRLVGSSQRPATQDRHAFSRYEFMKREGTLPLDHLERVHWDG
jgi:hypothetical protein